VAFALRFLESLEEASPEREVQIEKSSTLTTTKSYAFVGYFIAGLLIGLIIGGIAIFYTKRGIYK
jgi:hypothetical protein